MSEPWEDELSEAEIIAAVQGVSKPGSAAAWGECIAARIASYTPDEVRALIDRCVSDTDLMSDILETLDAAEKALAGRAALVCAAQARIFMVDLVDNPPPSPAA